MALNYRLTFRRPARRAFLLLRDTLAKARRVVQKKLRASRLLRFWLWLLVRLELHFLVDDVVRFREYGHFLDLWWFRFKARNDLFTLLRPAQGAPLYVANLLPNARHLVR